MDQRDESADIGHCVPSGKGVIRIDKTAIGNGQRCNRFQPSI